MHCTHCGKSMSEQAEVCPACGVRPYVTKNYCHSCGAGVSENQAMCVTCGSVLKEKRPTATATASTSNYNPILMGFLSFLITGLGQMVMGQVKKGIALLVGSVVLAFFTFGISAFITLIISVVDAALIANKKQRGQEVGEWEFF